jgi:hypothetical protein
MNKAVSEYNENHLNAIAGRIMVTLSLQKNVSDTVKRFTHV